MANMEQVPQGLVKLDLKKYNLEHLENTDSSIWTDADIEKLISAFSAENIAPSIQGIQYNPENVYDLLSISTCRRCGQCCKQNPDVPYHPGVVVSTNDLKKISDNSPYTYKFLKKKAVFNTDPRYPHLRYLPLPCIFLNRKNNECKIYEIRPQICTTYPISDIPNDAGISIDLRCDYGKDIYRYILKNL